MLKTLFIIATILVAVALALQQVEDGHAHHKRQQSQHVAPHAGHLTDPTKLHQLHEEHKEQHGRVKVPVAPHHSKSHRNGRRHKAAKGGKSSKAHHHQQHQKSNNRHKKQSHKAHGHGRKHQ